MRQILTKLMLEGKTFSFRFAFPEPLKVANDRLTGENKKFVNVHMGGHRRNSSLNG